MNLNQALAIYTKTGKVPSGWHLTMQGLKPMANSAYRMKDRFEEYQKANMAKKKTRKKARRKTSGRRKKTKKSSGNSFKVCMTRAQLKRLGLRAI